MVLIMCWFVVSMGWHVFIEWGGLVALVNLKAVPAAVN